jgi:uncharacterized OB-fold protein
MSKQNEKEVELLTVHSRTDVEQVFHYSAGRYLNRFLTEMRDNAKIVGVKCPKCGIVYAPPKEVCDPCYAEMTEPVEVGPEGTIRNCTILRAAIVDPETGETRPVPYTFGNVQLDGAGSLIQNYLEADDDSKIKVGARVVIEFHDERTGNMRDIRCFRVID